MINRLLVFFLLLFAAASSYAEPAVKKFRATSALGGGLHDSLLTICALHANYLNTPAANPHKNRHSCNGIAGATSYWIMICTEDNSYCIEKPGQQRSELYVEWVCADGSEPQGEPTADTACSNAGPPPPPPPPKCATPRGAPVRFGLYTGWGPIGSETSDGSESNGYPKQDRTCKVSDIEVVACYAEETQGRLHYYCVYNGVSTGEPADAGGSGVQAPIGPPSNPSGNPNRTPVPPFDGKPGGGCPKGTVQGGVGPDGVPMCIGTGTAPVNAPSAPPTKTNTETTSNPDGGTTQTTTTVKTNADGSTTTTVVKVVTGADGTKTVTENRETSKTPTGADGRETPDKSEQKPFCQENPNLSICRESSVAGKCGEISCVGDAIQCATLRAAAAMQCKQVADEDALKAMPAANLGGAILNGNDPMSVGGGGIVPVDEIDMSRMALDQSGFVGGGSCFPNKTINVLGKSVTMDFTSVCNNIQPLRYAIMACALVVAYLLVARSILQS